MPDAHDVRWMLPEAHGVRVLPGAFLQFSLEAEALHAAYDGMAPANFSRSVLSNADELAVLPVADSGWCDWGSPQRVFASLAGTACHARLVARIHGDMARAGAVS